ncbi:GxxExxY protein [Patescibacteria group bacterium]|nr:GxxExxY protein [Patescibacteria group bacterium]
MSRKVNRLFYPKLSYTIVGLCFAVHNELGSFSREKQYCDLLAKKFKEENISFKRELLISNSGNILDFLIDNKIVLEAKAKRIVTKNDYFQIQRYLQETKMKLGLIVNFRNKYLAPKRIVRIDTNVG